MKHESKHRPAATSVERHGGSAEVILRENIAAEERTGDYGPEQVFTYDEYRLTVPDRDNLEGRVRADRAGWLAAARATEYETLAAAVRARRDRMLRESDARMSLDRLKLDVSSAARFIRSLTAIYMGPWAQYRQALRDLPEQPGFPFEVRFPTPPGEVPA